MMGGKGRQSTLDTLLEGENVALEDILNDSEILTECKWANSKLMS